MPPRQKTSYRVSSSLSVTTLEINGIVLNELNYTAANTTYFYSGKHPVINLVLKNKYVVTANGKTFTCPAGKAIIIKDHKTLPVEFAEAGTKIFSIEFTPSLCQQFGLPVPGITTHIFPQGNLINTLLFMLFNEYNINNDDLDHTVHGIIEILLVKIKRETLNLTIPVPAWVPKLRMLLAEHLHEKIDLYWLVEKLGVSYNHLSRAIPKYFNCTFHELLLTMRLEKAITLLAANTNSLAEIADLCGFYDQRHFIRHFHNHYGYHPNHYPKQPA